MARSTKELLNLYELCRDNGVKVRLAKEGEIDFGTSHGELYLTILAGVATFEAQVTGERMADAVRARRERGDVMGIPPFGKMLVNGKLEPNPAEPIEPIIAAYQAAGSCYGAARALNEAGSRTRRGANWTSKVIGQILQREGVTYRRRPNPGAKGEADWITYRLLTCPHDGHVMTTMDKRSPRLTCWRARHASGHPRPFGIAESKILPAIIAEADRLQPPAAYEEDNPGERRQALEAKRERVLDLFVNGIVDRAGRDRRLADLDDEMEQLEAVTRLEEVAERIDWEHWSPRAINRVLRAIFERIELGPDLTPAEFVWRVPHWREP